MAIYNNVGTTNIPFNKGNVSPVKRSEQILEKSTASPVASIPTSIPNSSDFSLALSKQQQQSINDTIGYDQPSAKDRGALDAYHQVSTQEKRDQVIDSMSFHFVV